MKKAIFVSAIFTAICTLAFSERAWLFESGGRDLDGKVFGRISVINKTGREIEVSGEPLENNGKGLYFEDSILISGNCDDCEAFYSIEAKYLQIIVCPREYYEPDSKTYILPPMRISHRNPPPPPPRHRDRYDHGPAPKKMEHHNSLRHHEMNDRGHRHDSAPSQNDARPSKPDSPKRDSRMPRSENPRRPAREKNR